MIKIFKNLFESNVFQYFLEIALAAGNYLNGQTARGGAFAFKLDSALLFNDVLQGTTKFTLLMYLIDEIEKKFKLEFITKEE